MEVRVLGLSTRPGTRERRARTTAWKRALVPLTRPGAILGRVGSGDAAGEGGSGAFDAPEDGAGAGDGKPATTRRAQAKRYAGVD